MSNPGAKLLDVSEHFYSVQGEGPTAGMPAYFIRLHGCNMLCGGPGGKWVKEGRATWHCDTELVWKQSKALEYRELLQAMQESGVIPYLRERAATLVWTGGEPLVNHPPDIQGFLQYFETRMGYKPRSEVETNGTVMHHSTLNFLHAYVDQVNCSPKLANSGVRENLRFQPDVLRNLRYHRNAWFKFVVTRWEDVEEIKNVWMAHVHRERIILMPGASSREELGKVGPQVAKWAMALGIRYSTRLQLALWDRATGV